MASGFINGELLVEDLEFLSDREQELLSGGQGFEVNITFTPGPAGNLIPGTGINKATVNGVSIPWQQPDFTFPK
jgi:hypothetical protein